MGARGSRRGGRQRQHTQTGTQDALVQYYDSTPPHSLHVLLMRWCWQISAPPHFLHLLLWRWCWQMLAPPHSLHLLLWRGLVALSGPG